LLNLRGSDIAYNPVFFAYVLLGSTTLEIFIDPIKLTDVIRKNLETEGGQVTFYPYESILERLKEHVRLIN